MVYTWISIENIYKFFHFAAHFRAAFRAQIRKQRNLVIFISPYGFLVNNQLLIRQNKHLGVKLSMYRNFLVDKTQKNERKAHQVQKRTVFCSETQVLMKIPCFFKFPL